MLSATFNGDEILSTGEVAVGDVYPGFCCDGHGWEVSVTFTQLDDVIIWGVCLNPECPKFQPELGPVDDPYHGVSNTLQCDLAEWLAETSEAAG